MDIFGYGKVEYVENTNYVTDTTVQDSNIAKKVNRSGDTMTGFLSLSANPTSANHATTKSYVDVKSDLKYPVAGGSITGFMTLHSDPIQPLHASTKQYVDTKVSQVPTSDPTKLPLAGGTMAGDINMGSYALTNINGFVYANGSYINNDSTNQIRISTSALIPAGTTNIGSNSVPFQLGYFNTVFANAMNILGNPVATQNYVNTQISAIPGGSDNTKLPLAGGTMSGNINLNNNALVQVSTLQFNNSTTLEGVGASNMFIGASVLRPNTGLSCDLGSASQPFTNIYANSIVSNGNITCVGGMSVSALTVNGTPYSPSVSKLYGFLQDGSDRLITIQQNMWYQFNDNVTTTIGDFTTLSGIPIGPSPANNLRYALPGSKAANYYVEMVMVFRAHVDCSIQSRIQLFDDVLSYHFTNTTTILANNRTQVICSGVISVSGNANVVFVNGEIYLTRTQDNFELYCGIDVLRLYVREL